jgi:hypothetical protein
MKSSLSLPQAVDFYLRSRRRLGFALKTEERLLRSVVAFAQRIHHRGPLTEAWIGLVCLLMQIPCGGQNV